MVPSGRRVETTTGPGKTKPLFPPRFPGPACRRGAGGPARAPVAAMQHNAGQRQRQHPHAQMLAGQHDLLCRAEKHQRDFHVVYASTVLYQKNMQCGSLEWKLPCLHCKNNPYIRVYLQRMRERQLRSGFPPLAPRGRTRQRPRLSLHASPLPGQPPGRPGNSRMPRQCSPGREGEVFLYCQYLPARLQLHPPGRPMT